MEKKEIDQPNTIETVQEGYYDAMGFGPRDSHKHNSVHITQEEIDDGDWDDVELITLEGDNIGSLHLNGQKIDGDRKPINKQSAGRKKKRKRKKRRTRRRIKRKKSFSKKRKSRKRKRTKRNK